MDIKNLFSCDEKNLDKEYIEARKNIHEILEALPDGVYITDADSKTLYMNNSCGEILDMTQDDVIGKTTRELVEEGQLSVSASSEVIKHKKRSSVLQVVKGKTVLVTGTPVFDDNKDIKVIVSATRDITDLNHLRSQLDYESQLKDQYYNEMISLKASDAKRIESLLSDVRSKNMYDVVQLALQVAATDSTVLIQGESGVGKDVVARLIFSESKRRDKPFMKINCAAIPENLLESELFGYEDGAFTGAKRGGKSGLVEMADNGTLFLDEIAEMPLALQPKLLQIIQEKTFLRVGGIKQKEANVRIIAATNRDLESLVNEGKFRADLFYRLNVIPINIKPLKQRREDIPLLTHSFLKKFNEEYERNKVISHEAMEIMMDYSWPGNVRELENLIERLVVIGTDDLILPGQIPDRIKEHDAFKQVNVSGMLGINEAIEEVEKQLYLRAYAMTQSTHKAAKLLGVSQPTVLRKLNKYGKSPLIQD